MAARIKCYFFVPALLALLVSACSPVPTSPVPTSPVPTSQLTESPQSADGPQPAWVAAFSKPILFAIQDRPPDFQDDFSQPSDWVSASCGENEEPCGTILLADGVVTMTLGTGTFSVGTGIRGHEYRNFVLKIDVDLQQLDKDKNARIVWGNGYAFILHPYMGWNLVHYDEYISFSYGDTSADLSKPVTITLISKANEIAVYLNGFPLTYVKDIERTPNNFVSFGIWAPSPTTESHSISYDNLRLWDLDTVFAPPTAVPQPTAIPSPTAVPTPAAWIADFGVPFLEAIHGRDPDFQDDFSQVSSGWVTSPGGHVEIANGVLALSGGASQGVDNVKVPRSNFTNFVVQVDLNTGKLVNGCEATIQWRGGADGPGRIFGLQKNKWGFYSIYQTQDNFTYAEGVPSYGELPLSASGIHTITLISKDPEIGVYLDGIPLSHVVDALRPADPGFYFGLWYPEFCVAEFDNLKVWNLDK